MCWIFCEDECASKRKVVTRQANVLSSGFVIVLFHSAELWLLCEIQLRETSQARPGQTFPQSFPSILVVSCRLGLPFSSGPARSLCQDSLFPLLQNLDLLLVDTIQPVSEARADRAEDGVAPEHLPRQRAHLLEAELPCAGGHAC